MSTRAPIAAGLACALALGACASGRAGDPTPVAPARAASVALPTRPGSCAAVAARTLSAVAQRIEARADAQRDRPTGRPPTLVARLTGARVHACGADAAQTVADTVGAIGERLVEAEAHGPEVARALRLVAADPAFVRAVRTRDAAALRSAIVRFFRIKRLHIVRVRAVTADGRLVGDVGGPYVLAPASRSLRAGGRTIGRVTLSIQDDLGYVKLMRRFTGAAARLRTPAGVVPVASAPPRGVHLVRFAFATRAFPAGPLDVTLLIPVATQ